ncbi:SRR1L protein, partial [Cepphus grylle]|nr:SRR1L protein [Cepphus grylle]
MAAEGGWRPAGGGRRRRRRREEEAEGGAVVRRLREARNDLLSSGFWAACTGAVRAPLGRTTEPPARCVCYGLGRFSCCPAARHQLAFLLLLLEELGVRTGGTGEWGTGGERAPTPRLPLSPQVPPGRCSVFDPAFSAQEAAALVELGLRLLPHNEEGKHGIEGSATLFYMVHCGKALYNNLLWRNWSAGALSKMVIIGNSFKGIEERLLSRILERDYSYIAKVLKGTEEVALPAHPQYLDTFNDTSVHWFPLQKLKELSPEVWDFVEEPTYEEECEIIRKEDGADQRSPAAVES